MPIRVGRAVLAAVVFAVGMLAGSAGANADAFTPGHHGFLDIGGSFTQIDVPGATETIAYGINDVGQIVGFFSNSTGQHGFLYSDGSFTQIDVPGATSTRLTGINNAGQIIGLRDNSAFLDTNGTFTEISVPGASFTGASGINNIGQIVGTCFGCGIGQSENGFLYAGGSFTLIHAPGSFVTFADGINDAGQIVGGCFGCGIGQSENGFLYSGGSFTQFQVPGADSTFPSDINGAGQIDGSFSNGTGGAHGFLDSGANFTQIDVPGATETIAYGINDAGQIVGETMVSGGTGDPHFTTYNGVNYDFQGVGDFLLARSSVAGDQFDVEIRTRAWSNGTSLIEAAAATLCDHQVTFDVDHTSVGSGFVWLDGSPISLSVGGSGLAVGACKILEPSSMEYQVVWDTGETLDISDYGTWLAVSSQLSSIDGPGSVDGLLSSEVDPDRWRRMGTASLFDPVPEPSSLCLLSTGIGLIGLAIARHRKVSVKCSRRER
jgi:probable HAF family extracellular repeat protein